MVSEDLLIPLGMLGFIVAMFALAVGMQRRNLARWRDLGAALGLAAGEAVRMGPFEDFPLLRGNVSGREVRLRTYTTGSGKSQERWTSLEAAAPGADPGFDLRLSREGLGAALAKVVGGQDVVVGNEDFDRRFRVQGSDPPRAQRALGFGVQQAALEVGPFAELRVGAPPPIPALPRGWAVSARLAEALAAQGWREGEAVVRLVWPGLMLREEQVRAALPLVLKVAEGVEQAAPRA